MGPAGRRGGLGTGRRAAGPAGSCSPHCPLEAAARTPGSGLRSPVSGLWFVAAPRSSAPESGSQPRRTERASPGPFCQQGTRGSRAGWSSVWGDLGLGGAQVALSCGMEAAASGVESFSGPGPGPAGRPTHRGSGGQPGRRAPPQSPLSLPAAFTLSLPGRQRAALKGAAARQLAKQWRPRFPRPPPLGTEDGGGWVNGRLWRLGSAGCPL